MKFFGIKKHDSPLDSSLTRITWCRVVSRHKISVQADGEPIKPGNRKVLEFRCLPKAAKVLLRRHEAEALDTGPENTDDKII